MGSGKILFIIAVITNTIVFMNLLLSVVSGVQANVEELRNQYYYKQLVNRICMLQRVFFWYFYERDLDSQSLLFLAKECREYDSGTGTEVLEDTKATEEEITLEVLQETVNDAVRRATADLNSKIEKVLDMKSEQILKSKKTKTKCKLLDFSHSSCLLTLSHPVHVVSNDPEKPPENYKLMLDQVVKKI